MSELLVLNPHRRGSKKRKARRPGGSRHHSHKAKRKTHRRGGAIVVMANPHRRGGKRRKRHPVSLRRLTRGRRRNLIRMDIMSSIKDSALGAGGALALDLIFAKVSPHLGTMLGSLPAQYGMKGAIAIGLGVVSDKLLKLKAAKDIADGALTVTLHEAARAAIAQFAPQLNAQMGDLQITTMQPAYINPAPIVGRYNADGTIGDLQPYVQGGGVGDLQYNGRLPADIGGEADLVGVGA